MNKKLILGILAIAVVAMIGIGLFNYLNKPQGAIQEIEKPDGTLSVSELLENPVYDTEVKIYGNCELFGSSFL
jgi:hypothetical protein